MALLGAQACRVPLRWAERMLGRHLPGASPASHNMGVGWSGMPESLQSPRLLYSCPLPVLFMAQAVTLLGHFQRAGKDAFGSKGLTAKGQGIAETVSRSRSSNSSVVCPSHLDLPQEKVKDFREAQGDDLVNGCMTQPLPCGVGCFVSLIPLFTPVVNHWG